MKDYLKDFKEKLDDESFSDEELHAFALAYIEELQEKADGKAGEGSGYGTEIEWNAYLLYLQDWVKLHMDVKYRGESPLLFKEWRAFQ